MGKARFERWRNTHFTSLWKEMQRICDQFLQFNLRLFSRMYYWGVKPGIVSAGLEFSWPKVKQGIKLELQHQLLMTNAVHMKLFRETWRAPVQDPLVHPYSWDFVSIWCIDLCHLYVGSLLPPPFQHLLLLPYLSLIRVTLVFLVSVTAALFMDECSAALIVDFKTGHC